MAGTSLSLFDKRMNKHWTCNLLVMSLSSAHIQNKIRCLFGIEGDEGKEGGVNEQVLTFNTSLNLY